MREDYQEQLDKMFPDGYVIVYTNPNSAIRINIYNPHGDKTMFEYYDLVKTMDKD